MLRIVTDRWTDLFTDRQWWLLAWSATRNFWRHCLPCSLALVAANLIVIFVTAGFEQTLRGLQNSSTFSDLTNLMAIGIVALVATVISLGLCFWALTDWMIKLTAFASLLAGSQTAPSSEEFGEAVRQFVKRKWYLIRVWCMASVYLLVPGVPLSFFIGMRAVFGDAKRLITIEPSIVPAWLTDVRTTIAIGAAMFIFTLVTLVYSYVTIVFSAISDLPAARTANVAFRESMKNALPLIVITAIILLANVAVTAPQMVLRLTPLGPLCQTPLAEACAQIWLGITSLFVWPLSVAPFCRLIQRVD
jgi:hypothetical protein